MKYIASLCAAALLSLPSASLAWGPNGHQTVGAIADAQLKPHAKARVKSLIKMSLKTAGPWADCVKDVKHGSSGSHYVEDPTYKASCGVFWTPSAEAEILAYADANWDNCSRDGGQECHTQYHFADIDIDRPDYEDTFRGSNDHDLVHAIRAAIIVLKGGMAPAPFVIVNKRIALLMLAHLIGDMHQPLHVGSIYLDPNGQPHDPDVGTYDPTTFTRGGNFLFDGSKKLHSEWDDIGAFPTAATLRSLVAESKQMTPTPGEVEQFPVLWATDSIAQSKIAFSGLTFQSAGSQHWNINFADRAGYLAAVKTAQRVQLEKAGKRMADLLNAIWP